MQIGLFAAFGGGIVSSLLLQDPVSAPIALFHSNYLGIVWTVCWWLMNYCPKDLVASAHCLLPVRLVTKVPSCDDFALTTTLLRLSMLLVKHLSLSVDADLPEHSQSRLDCIKSGPKCA